MNRRTLLKRLGFIGAGTIVGAKTTKLDAAAPEPIIELPTPWFKSAQIKQPSMVLYWDYPAIFSTAVPFSRDLSNDVVFTPSLLTLNEQPNARTSQRICRECDEWTPDDQFCIECGAPL